MSGPERIELEQASGAVDSTVEDAQQRSDSTRAAINERRAFASSDSSSQERKLELGWIGRAFGGQEEKTGNIAATAIIFGFLLIIVLVVVETAFDKELEYSQVIVTGGISIITASLGYIYGVKKAKPDD